MAEAFASLAVLALPSPCRLLTVSCCPDKDLFVLISRLIGHDRVSLWKYNGTKVWETEMPSQDATKDTIQHVPAIAWSPDGHTIAVVYTHGTVSVRSIQDGSEERALSIPTQTQHKLTGIWWFKHDRELSKNPIPDVFRRNNILPGTAHSILKMLPLLDNVQEETPRANAPNLFTFHGSQTRYIPSSTVPDSIKLWPTLPSDPLLASLSVVEKTADVSGEPADTDNVNRDSILVVADSSGQLYPFLDGTFPLGTVPSLSGLESSDFTFYFSALQKHSRNPVFFGHLATSSSTVNFTSVLPTITHLPLLTDRRVRDFAQLSSSARELVWYVMRLVKELRDMWFGTETSTGARVMGSNWLKEIEDKQKALDENTRSPLFDLTMLLTTGHPSEPLSEFFSSHELMSERSLSKWDNTMSDALIKLRDYSEKRITPALQRLHIILEELKGWSSIAPEYSIFDLNPDLLSNCLTVTKNGITIASWLASAARKEHLRFKEFFAWVRWVPDTISSPQNNNETKAPPLPHDILEVNNYLISGLAESDIDKWFTGPPPSADNTLLNLERPQKLKTVLEQARVALSVQGFTQWPPSPVPSVVEKEHRNIDELVKTLSLKCQSIFASGASATSRDVRVACPAVSPSSSNPTSSTNENFRLKEICSVPEPSKDETLHVYSILRSSDDKSQWCICKQINRRSSPTDPAYFEFALLSCQTTHGEVLLLDTAFLTDNRIAVVFRQNQETPNRGYLGIGSYAGINFHACNTNLSSREEFMAFAFQQALNGTNKQFQIQSFTISHQRRLHGCDSGPATIAVNGTRNFAAVLDARGITLECIDLEIDEDEDEDEPNEEGVDVDIEAEGDKSDLL
ncbi:anaphase-promoting complex, cyclosome, subunit 4-domain-containing protein [Flagelloscypha sp. PMI_526]|nr:anaphase-promoting complex, cyclosome, subunit 4-domain-containing protein [Flagelloscypha sp. PMI_526]